MNDAKAKLIAMNDEDEYEVTLEVKGATLMCFAVVCPYRIDIGKYYPIEFSLNVQDGIEPKIPKDGTQGIEKISRGYEYILRGKLNNGKLDLGSFLLKMII